MTLKDKHPLRLIRLMGQPVCVLGRVVFTEGDYIVHDPVRIIEFINPTGSVHEFRADPLFPYTRPIRLPSTSVAYDRELLENTAEDQILITQYQEHLTKMRALASNIRLAK